MIDTPTPIQVLVVEDEPSIRLLLRRWIERSLNAEVEEAADGLEALEIIAKGKAELIITDLNMPVLNGTDMLTLLQTDPRRRSLELLVVTQVAGEEIVRQAIQLGVSDYLLKPLQYDWVVERLQRAADRILERRKHTDEQGDHSLPRVLIVDGDPNFNDTAEAALFGRFATHSARSVAETLVWTLRFKPDALLVSPQLSGLKMDFLLARVRGLPGDRKPRVFELLGPGSGDPHPDVDGVVSRSFVPEKFRASVIEAFGDLGPDAGNVFGVESLAGELATALYQAFGMMTGEEPEKLDADRPEESEIYGSIDLTSAAKDFVLTLELRCDKALDRAVITAMLGEEPADDEAPGGAVSELLNVIAGRIKNSCTERDVDVALGLPQCSTSRPTEPTAVENIAEAFKWRDHILGTCLSINRNPVVAEPAVKSEPEAAAESKPEPAAESEPEAAADSKPEPAAEATADPDAEAAPETPPEPVAKAD